MKKILGLVALTAAMAITSSASQILVQCGQFQDGLGNSTDSTLGLIPNYPSGTIQLRGSQRLFGCRSGILQHAVGLPAGIHDG